MKFVGLVGSNYDQSYNRKLLEFIRRHFKIKFELEVLEIDEVPMFNQDEKGNKERRQKYIAPFGVAHALAFCFHRSRPP